MCLLKFIMRCRKLKGVANKVTMWNCHTYDWFFILTLLKEYFELSVYMIAWLIDAI